MSQPRSESEFVALFESFLRDRSMEQKRAIVFERDGWECRLCGRDIAQVRLELDQIVPSSRGGTDDITNLQTLCKDCNKRKSDSTHFN